MKYPRVYSLVEIAQLINAKYIGNKDLKIFGQNEIHVVREGEIVFVDHPKYYDKALQSNASVILIDKEVECPKGKALLISHNPFSDFNILSTHFKPFIKSTTNIDSTAIIGENTWIQPNVIIGANVCIGKNCIIHSGVVINYNCTIEDNCIIHPNVVIGSEAFYYKRLEDGFEKLLSSGDALIEQNVELGAGTTIDRGVSGTTIIKKNTKIDNLCHIGHDSVVGENCLIAAHASIAGCVIIENKVNIWGKVAITNGVTIGEGAVINGFTGVTKSIPGGKTYFGVPAMEMKAKLEEMFAIKQAIKMAQKEK